MSKSNSSKPLDSDQLGSTVEVRAGMNKSKFFVDIIDPLSNKIALALQENQKALKMKLTDNHGNITIPVLASYIEHTNKVDQLIDQYKGLVSEIDAQINRCSDQDEKQKFLSAKKQISEKISVLATDNKKILLSMKTSLESKKDSPRAMPATLHEVEQKLTKYENVAVPQETSKEPKHSGLVDYLRRHMSKENASVTQESSGSNLSSKK